MVYGTRRLKINLTVLVMVLAFYAAVLAHNLNESERRSLYLKGVPPAGDSVVISLRVVSVNPRTSDVTARLTFRLQGSIAKDPVVPAVPLSFFLNDIRGPQEIVWPRDRRVNPLEASFSLDGNENKYPIDSYSSEIRMLVTRMDRAVHAGHPVSPPQEDQNAPPPADSDGGLVVTAAQEGERVPIALSIDASIPGLKFSGAQAGPGRSGFEGFDVAVRRADNVIVVSVLIMVLMMSLAMSVLTMAMGSALADKLELVPLSLSVSLLFGLPALRNAQPGAPPIGAFGDYVSFIWAELIVAVAGVTLIWIWLVRHRHAR